MARKKATKHTSAFKAQVALAALVGDRTANELAAQHGIHPNLVYAWKKLLLTNAARLFEDPTSAANDAHHESLQAELFQQIGKLKMELEWLKIKHDTLG